MAGPRIERAALAKGERNFEPVDPATVFRPNVKEIFLVGRVADAPRGTRLKATWRAVDVPDYRGPEQVLEKELQIDGPRPFVFSLDPSDPLPPGKYAAELSLNGRLAQSLPFSVVPPILPVLARPENELPSPPGASPPAEPKPTNLQFIVDASGSMADPVGGVQKMDAAREALHSLVSALPVDKPDISVGLRAYAHRYPTTDRARSCEDTELLVPMQGVDKAKLRGAIDSLTPTGWTPMAFAVQQAAKDFAAGQAQNVIVLVTDGEETCAPDPVAPIKAAADPARIAVHVVGFDIGEEKARTQLRSIAQATGGIYVDARTAEELAAALRRIAAEQVQVVRVRTAAGQLNFEPPQGTAFYGWTVKDAQGNEAIREYGNDKNQANYQLPAGLYTAEFRPTLQGEAALFRLEIAAGYQSVLRLGALKLLARQQPYRWVIFDQAMEREIVTSYGNDMPKEPILVPPGKYTISVQLTLQSKPTVHARDVEVKPNSIVEVEF